jgi:hypothetical protein
MSALPLYINGNEKPSAASEHIDVVNPATQELLCK